MKGSQVVRVVMNAWESHNSDELHNRLAEDCICTGLIPQPLNKAEFIGIALAILEAMPDLALHATNFQEEGEKVRVQLAITGRHIRELRLPGLASVAASGKKIALPTETHEYTIRGEMISALAIEPVEGGGIAGLLAQLGVSLPETAKKQKMRKLEQIELAEPAPKKTRKRAANGETKARGESKSRKKAQEPARVTVTARLF